MWWDNNGIYIACQAAIVAFSLFLLIRSNLPLMVRQAHHERKINEL